MTCPATTFALLRQHDACMSGYRKLAKYLGGINRYGADKSIPLTVVLKSNGLDDTLWCLRALVGPWDREARLFSTDCAKHVKRSKYLWLVDSLTFAENILEVTWGGQEVTYCKVRRDYGCKAAMVASTAEKDWQANRLLEYFNGQGRE